MFGLQLGDTRKTLLCFSKKMNWVHSDRVPLVPGAASEKWREWHKGAPLFSLTAPDLYERRVLFWAPRLHLKPSGVGHGFGYRSMICAFHSGSH